MTLACEDVDLKVFVVVIVADVGAEKRVDDSLVQMWKLKIGHQLKFLFRFRAQGLVKIFWLNFKILKFKFSQNVDVW